MAAVEQTSMDEALFHLRLAELWGTIVFICVGISIGSHVADYPHRWVVHWIALLLGAVTIICQLLVLRFAVRRAAAPQLAAVQQSSAREMADVKCVPDGAWGAASPAGRGGTASRGR